MTSPNLSALQAIPPATFTYVGQAAAAGYIKGGVLIGDLVNNSSTTPAGSDDNIPTVTLSAGVPISAALELQSTTGALCIMRMTTTQRNAMITVVNGMMIYNTTTTTFQFYQNGAWVSLSAGAGGVVGPGGGSTDTAIATWNGAGGNALNNSVVLLDGSGNITGVNTIANAIGTAAAPSYTFTARTNTGMYSSAANTLDFATDGTRQLEVGGAVVAVNYATITGSTTGNPVLIGALGTDGNVSIELVPKGTGQVLNAVGAVATPSYSFVGRTDTGIYSSAAATIDFASTGGRNVSVLDSAGTTVNYITLKGNITTAAPVLGVTGTDGNVGLTLSYKGTGGLYNAVGAIATPSYSFTGRTDTGMWSSAASTIDFSTTGGRQLQVGNVSTAVDYLVAKGSATNGANAALQPSLVAAGSDTVIDVAVVGKGAGSGLAVLANSAAGAGSIKLWNGAANFYGELVPATMGQNSVLTIPDPGGATGNVVIAPSALVAGNLVKASGTAGLVVDAGISAATGVVLNASGTISDVNFQGMYATPVQLIAAPGSGLGILVLTAYLELVFAGAAPGGGGVIVFQYGNTVHGAGVNTIINGGTTTIAATFATTAAVTQWTTLANGANIGTTATSTTTDLGVFLSNQTGAFTANGGTSSLKWAVSYMVVGM